MAGALRGLNFSTAIFVAAISCFAMAGSFGAETMPPKEGKFEPSDVDFEKPVFEASFDKEDELKNFQLEGGKDLRVADGNLVIESDKQVVCWLKKEIPADFLLEFTVRPKDRANGLNIVFFNTRGVKGESIFDPALKPRDGTFDLYHSGDIKGYHVSYWAGTRGFANLRKNDGFHLIASGEDRIKSGQAGTFQTVRVYKRGGVIRLTVDGVVSLAHEDEGKVRGPHHSHSGWIGLRQMAHTAFCEYGHVKVWPLKSDAKP